VAPYAEVECVADVIAFARTSGLPLVLKPRNGGGSVDLEIVHDEDDVDRVLAGDALVAGAWQPNLIVETFIPGAMCHVDGLVVNGRVVFAWASQYLYALASYRSDPNGRLDARSIPTTRSRGGCSR
jgi:hypothetical protein